MKKILSRTILGASALAFASSADAAVIFLSFTNASSVAASGTESFNTLASAGSSSLALNDQSGASSGITVTSGATGITGGNSTGATAVAGAAAAAGITQTAASTYHFSSESSIGSYTFSGLDATGMTNYTFTAFGSRNAADTRPTDYVLSNGITSQTLTASPSGPVNNTEVQVFNAVTTASGNLTLTFQGQNTMGNRFGYINAVRIDTATGMIPEPASALLLGSAGLLGLLRRRRA